MQKLTLIMCPRSRSGRGRRLWKYWLDRLDSYGIDYSVVETEYAGHAREIAYMAESDVVAVGGDGTINEVLDGVVSSRIEKAMGILYSGTSPDFCQFHNLSVEPSQAVEQLLSDVYRRVDVVKVEFYNALKEQTSHFGCSCNIGMGCEVAGFANSWRRYLGDTIGTFAGVVKAIASDKEYSLELKIDGVPFVLEKCRHLIVLKNPYIASGMKIDIDIDVNDGVGYVLGIMASSRVELLQKLPAIYNGRIMDDNNVFIKKFSRVEICSEQNVDIEFDGDPQGTLPVKAEVIRSGLTLMGANNERV